VVLDRDSGRAIVIQCPFSDPVVPNSSLYFNSDLYGLTPEKLALLVNCLLIIQALPEAALEEAFEELEGIYRFYINRLPEANATATIIPARTIKGTLNAVEVRPPIVLEP
jgi:hypothetical protein